MFYLILIGCRCLFKNSILLGKRNNNLQYFNGRTSDESVFSKWGSRTFFVYFLFMLDPFEVSFGTEIVIFRCINCFFYLFIETYNVIDSFDFRYRFNSEKHTCQSSIVETFNIKERIRIHSKLCFSKCQLIPCYCININCFTSHP